MNEFNQSRTTIVQSKADVDAGLRSYMLKVYNYMSLGMAITGLVAYVAAGAAINNGVLTSFGELIFQSPLKWVIMFAPLGVVLVFSMTMHKLASQTALMVFFGFSALMGLSIAFIFLVYTSASIFQTFIATTAAFGSLSLYGYTTRRNLSGLGSFLIMGVVGIIVASIVNIFLASSALDFAISVLGVLLFAGLTAYDTQSIKEMYSDTDSNESQAKKAIHGALRLYLDFLNMFMFLLRFMGSRN